MDSSNDFNYLIITGMSGAGKTCAIRALEDIGYFCVDNLPPALLSKFAELYLEAERSVKKVALVIDIRGGGFFDKLFQSLDELKKSGIAYEILFLEASTEALVQRFKETRRRHPLSNHSRLLEDILLERKRLEELRGVAHKIIDTTGLGANQLKEEIIELFGPHNKKVRMQVTVMSFGYKYGIPLDADLVVDVRFLPNPFYIGELSAQTGCDEKVSDYVLKNAVTEEFLKKYYDILMFLLPHYLQEGKTHLVIAIGCTGGRHRSVALAVKLGEMLSGSEYKVSIRHRDVERKGAEEEPR